MQGGTPNKKAQRSYAGLFYLVGECLKHKLATRPAYSFDLRGLELEDDTGVIDTTKYTL